MTASAGGFALTPVFVWGAGGHALVVADALRERGGYRVTAFLDTVTPERDGEEFDGAVVYAGPTALARVLAAGLRTAAIGIGNNLARLRLATAAAQAGVDLVTAVHPRAVVARSVRLGAGTVVAAGAVLNPLAACGRCVIVNTAASVDHECRLDDGASVGPGARLAGNVRVGAAAVIGIGAVVRERVTIGAGSVIGAGAVVVRDVPAGVVAYGVPARVVREVERVRDG